MKIFSVLILLAIVDLYAASGPVWTTPSKVKVSSFVVEKYGTYRTNHNISVKKELPDLDRSYSHEEAFVGSLFSALDKKYPNKKKYRDTQVSSTGLAMNGNAIAKNYRDATLYHSEFVFFSGHGDQQELLFYDYSVNLHDGCRKNVCTQDDYGKVYGGETRWVILDACLTLNVNKSNRINLPLTIENIDFSRVDRLRSVFSGVHAILGFYSDGWQGSDWIGGNYVVSDALYGFFVENFIERGESIWNSFSMTGAEIVDVFNNIRGLQPAIAFLRGYDKNGIYHDTSMETFDRTYNKPIPIDGTLELFVMYETYGTPTYHSSSIHVGLDY